MVFLLNLMYAYSFYFILSNLANILAFLLDNLTLHPYEIKSLYEP